MGDASTEPLQSSKSPNLNETGDGADCAQAGQDNGRRNSVGRASETSTSPEASLHNPVDTGWAWVIMMSAFAIQVVCIGLLRALGVIFVAIQETFHTSASMIALLGSVESASFSISGLLSMSVLLEIVTVRQVVLVGAFIGSCGIAVSCLATHVSHLVASFSICFGIGMALCIPTCFSLLNAYFKKKFPLATAIVNTGGSIGGVFMPIATRLLLDEYYLAGTFLLLGAVFAQNLVAGVLLTPPSDYKPRTFRDDGSGLTKKEKKMQELRRRRLVKIRAESERTRTVSESAAVHHKSTEYDVSGLEPLTKCLQAINRHTRDGCGQSRKTLLNRSRTKMSSFNSLVMVSSLGGSHCVSLARMNLDVNDPERQLTSLQCLEVAEVQDAETEDCSEESDEPSSCCRRLCQMLSETLFDPALYRSTVFWLLALYHYMGGIGSGLPAAFLPFLAQEKGLTATQGALLVTISGALDIISRFVPGVLVQSKLVQARTLTVVSILIIGVLLQFTNFADGMVSLTLITVVYGLFSGVFFSMLSLIILEMCDLENFNKVFGFTQLSLGMAGITGFPIVGYLRDMSGSYVPAFHFMGACGLLSAFLLFTLPLVHRWEEKRKQTHKATTTEPVH